MKNIIKRGLIIYFIILFAYLRGGYHNISCNNYENKNISQISCIINKISLDIKGFNSQKSSLFLAAGTVVGEVLTGFTLAEVLITLLIIGIIASIVIPALINDVQDAELKTKWKKEFGVITQAYKNVKLDDGDYNFIFTASSGTDLNNKMSKYFNIAKFCGTYYDRLDCFVSHTAKFNYKSLDGSLLAASMFDNAQFYLTDGSFIMIEEYGKYMYVDVNGFEKGPNVLGKDLFGIKALSDRILPLGADGTGETMDTCNNTPKNCTTDMGNGTSTPCAGAGCSFEYLK